LSVFDAAHIGDGPLAQARLLDSLPLGLHGTFRPEMARR
jgi:carotenoid cleavage dioxygenase-like enzyme